VHFTAGGLAWLAASWIAGGLVYLAALFALQGETLLNDLKALRGFAGRPKQVEAAGPAR